MNISIYKMNSRKPVTFWLVLEVLWMSKPLYGLPIECQQASTLALCPATDFALFLYNCFIFVLLKKFDYQL